MNTLRGIQVVSIALNVPGPVVASRLSEAGAAVIKVEPPGGDPLEAMAPAWYSELHRNIAIHRLDLKSASGQERLREWLRHAQLFLSSQRPSALARLQLDADSLAADPSTAHLRVLNIVGETAAPERAGHDLTYMAKAGLLGGEAPRTLVADLVGAERAFAAALILLREPEGARAQVGLADGVESLAAPRRHGLTKAGGLLNGGLAAYGLYDASDGKIAVAALEPHFRERLYRWLARPLDSSLDDAFLDRSRHDWEVWGQDHDVPISAVED